MKTHTSQASVHGQEATQPQLPLDYPPTMPTSAIATQSESPPEGDRLPTPFLTRRVHDLDVTPSLTAVCAGYEEGEWQAARLATHMLDWVPDFALRAGEKRTMDIGTAQEQIRRAVRTVFGSRSAGSGGEPGEILLHIVCREVFHSETVISKVFFKTSANEPVKGFDCVHVVHAPEGLELWLGEAKFYTACEDAVRAALASVRAHLATDYLRGEFSLITDKINDKWPYANVVRRLIHENVPIDQVFQYVTVPVLLAYDSPAVCAHDKVSAEFQMAFAAEARELRHRFEDGCASPSLPVRVRLFLAPLGSKRALVTELDKRLQGWR